MKVRSVAPRTCAHHWLIDTPAGPTSEGRCKLCGERKDFRNYDQYDSLPSSWKRQYGGQL